MKSAFSGETCNKEVVRNYEKMLSMYSLGAKISGIIPQRAPVQLLHCHCAAPVGCQHPSTKFPLPKNASDGRQFALQADQKHSTIAGHRGSSHVSSSSVCRPCPLYSLFSLPAWIWRFRVLWAVFENNKYNELFENNKYNDLTKFPKDAKYIKWESIHFC